MHKIQKPRIIELLITNKDNKIEKMIINGTVKKVGDSGYIAIPKELVGQYIKIKIEVIK